MLDAKTTVAAPVLAGNGGEDVEQFGVGAVPNGMNGDRQMLNDLTPTSISGPDRNASADEGHELANHTFTHPALGSVDRARLRSEIVRCRDVLARQTGSGGRWFRPSGVERPTAPMLEEAGIAGYATIVGYDVDPLDYQDPGAAAVARRVEAGLHGGSIVSLHTGHAATVEAFPQIVAAVRARGLEPVLLSDLIAVRR